MQPWFERDPGLLARELDALAQIGADAQIDEEARAAGVLRLLIDYPAESGSIQLIGLYPDLYPFFRPEVIAPALALPRHQQPISKALCLIGRRTSRWYAEDTLATLLEQQLPRLLPMAGGAPIDTVLPYEEPQGEPVSDYYNSEAPLESFLLFDGGWTVDPACAEGTFVARIRYMSRADAPELTVQGYITEIRCAAGRPLVQWDSPALPGFPEQITGRWLRLEQAPLGGINPVLDALGSKRDWLKDEKSWSNKRHLALGLLLFPEEVGQQVFADGWGAVQWLSSRQQKGQQRRTIGTFLRTFRAGRDDLAARMPATRALRDRSVALFGCGAIGAQAAVELARAGVGRMLLIDHDVVDPATVRRWPFGVTAFGAHKVEVLRTKLEADYPWTKVEVDTLKVGATEDSSFPAPQGERLEDLLADRDLIIDCTAELGVNHFLSEFARVHGIPYLLANATPGAWGGMVANFTGEGACWLCLRHALYGDDTLPLPPTDPAGELQPPGCADPTFSGSGFDLAEVSLELVRTAAGMLSPGDDGYPRAAWQFSVLRLRAEDGARIPPCWEGMTIPARPACSCQQ